MTHWAGELLRSPVIFVELITKVKKPGASISPTRPFCTLSMAERAAVMIVQLVRVCLVISVEPDSSNARLNTTRHWSKTISEILYFLARRCTKSLLSFSSVPCWLFSLNTNMTALPAPSNILRSAAVDLGSMETLLSTHHRFQCHTHVVMWPVVSKGRLQKFPLLIVRVHVCACRVYPR